MGTVYARGNRLWIAFVDGLGKRRWKPTGLAVGQEKDAQKRLEAVEARVAAELELGNAGVAVNRKGLTVEDYADVWLKRRLKRSPAAAKENEWQLRLHIKPLLGSKVLVELRPRHIRDFLADLKTRDLAARSIRAIYAGLRVMLAEAVIDELISSTPCVLLRGDLPAIADKDPRWRAGAVFARREVERLISDDRLTDEHRVANGLFLLTGMRPGEVSALRWRHYSPNMEPLGRLEVVTAYNSRMHLEKGTKTNRVRLVPVHPALATLLAAWRLGGWAREHGRTPGAEDYVLPARQRDKLGRLRPRDVWVAGKGIQADLAALGLPKRRLYDSKRTFISLVPADGGRKDILHWVTHGASSDILDVYTTLPWPTLCAEVAKLRIELRADGDVVTLPGRSENSDRECEPPEERGEALSKQGVTVL